MFRPTNLPTHKTKHPTMGGEVSKDSKSSNRIEISQFVQVLLCFYWFRGTPRGFWEWGWVGVPQTHMYMRMHMHACACTGMHVKHDKHGCLHGGNHLQFPNMFILAFHACVCMHMHVHMSRDTPMPSSCPQMLPNPSALFPEPQGGQITESL